MPAPEQTKAFWMQKIHEYMAEHNVPNAYDARHPPRTADEAQSLYNELLRTHSEFARVRAAIAGFDGREIR